MHAWKIVGAGRFANYMLDPSIIAAFSGDVPLDQLRRRLETFFPKNTTEAARIQAIETILRSPLGLSLRETMARWIVDEIVPVEKLIPEAYLKWRPPVREAMIFVVSHLSPARLAPKLLEQIDLPAKTSAETRLLHLISKVPGLQKLGQVIARNQHLSPALRKALARLENGIHDVTPVVIREIIHQELGLQLRKFSVVIGSNILKEASVSAVVRFTWQNPATGIRERGVFKVLKPHIPEYFSEDMEYLHKLAEHFGDAHHRYGLPSHLLPDTFQKVRRLLRHEVNFVREQKTLIEAGALYVGYPGVGVPRLISPLCTRSITAITEEPGIKVTNAAVRLPAARRQRLAQQIVEALVAVPLLAAAPEAIFHGDPHAGNLLYDERTARLTMIDWALRERLDRENRRHLALLFVLLTLRDRVGLTREVAALSQHRPGVNARQNRIIREVVTRFLDQLPTSHLPSAADAMRLLERVAVKGIRFPTSLIILSKVMFTLEGVLADVLGAEANIGPAIARHVAQRWIVKRSAFRSPLRTRDWLSIQCSALLYTGRLCVDFERQILDRWLKPKPIFVSAA